MSFMMDVARRTERLIYGSPLAPTIFDVVTRGDTLGLSAESPNPHISLLESFKGHPIPSLSNKRAHAPRRG
jgi:hypothetical protein